MTLAEIKNALQTKDKIDWFEVIKDILRQTNHENVFIEISASGSNLYGTSMYSVGDSYARAGGIALYNGNLFVIVNLVYGGNEYDASYLGMANKGSKQIDENGVGLTNTAAKNICKYLINEKLYTMFNLPDWTRTEMYSDLGDLIGKTLSRHPQYKQAVVDLVEGRTSGYMEIN